MEGEKVLTKEVKSASGTRHFASGLLHFTSGKVKNTFGSGSSTNQRGKSPTPLSNNSPGYQKGALVDASDHGIFWWDVFMRSKMKELVSLFFVRDTA